MTLIHISLWINETKSRERRAKGYMLVSLKVYEHCECAPKNTCTFYRFIHHRVHMNEWWIYIAPYCVLLYTQALYNHVGGVSPQPPRVCSIHLNDATYATGQRRQCSPHTSYRWRGERDIEPIKCMRSPHTRYRWRGERDIEPIKCMRSPHTSYRWRGERVIEPIKWMGIIRRPWLTRASGGNLARAHGSRSHNSVLLWFEWWV